MTAVALAGVAGYVDAAGFLTLGGLFTAHMSGNTARLGVRLGGGQLGAALPLAVAIALFVIGVMAGAAASELLMRRGGASTVAAILTAQALLLLAFTLKLGRPWWEPGETWRVARSPASTRCSPCWCCRWGCRRPRSRGWEATA